MHAATGIVTSLTTFSNLVMYDVSHMATFCKW